MRGATGSATVPTMDRWHIPVDKQLLDEAVDAYVDWREECLAVRDAYRRWTGAPSADARLAFVAYTAALEIEEQASAAYAGVMGRVGDVISAEPRALPEIVVPYWRG